MKLGNKTKAFIIVLLLVRSIVVQAQNSWAMVTVESGKNWPSFSEFHCLLEKGANNMEYNRIYDESYRTRQEQSNPVKLQYGYRISEKKIFIYDFDTNTEKPAFDFTLFAGDHFITYNGIEWVVKEAKDTIVNVSYEGKGDNCTKRLLKVQSDDGRFSDQWLEDFGSFANHFMILPMDALKHTHTLWMEYGEGCYLAREISSDPIFTHDSGKPDVLYGPTQKDEYVNVVYDNGTLMVEEEGWHSPNRQYSCFYRMGDDLYCSYRWDLNPASMTDEEVWHKSSVYYYGLPRPESGQYNIHLSTQDNPSGMSYIYSVAISETKSVPVHYGLDGRVIDASIPGMHIIKYSDGAVKKIIVTSSE